MGFCSSINYKDFQFVTKGKMYLLINDISNTNFIHKKYHCGDHVAVSFGRSLKQGNFEFKAILDYTVSSKTAFTMSPPGRKF